MRVCLVGATGTIGRATARALLRRGHDVVCFARPPADPLPDPLPARAGLRLLDVTSPEALTRDGFRGEHWDAVISCMASRGGVPADAWAIDHRAHLALLDAARAAGVAQFVLLSAICVQKPRLAFQHAKLAFEAALAASGLRYSIVRPTAYFKSLSGQIDRVRRGRPYLLFADGRLTACKPIADDDLADYLVDCLHAPRLWNRILPIGGPGPAITPREQGAFLFAQLGRPPRFRQIPLAVLDTIVAGTGLAARLLPGLEAKAELARIGRYYASESMLVLDPRTGSYNAAATPETGRRTLFGFYAAVLAGADPPDRREHAVF